MSPARQQSRLISQITTWSSANLLDSRSRFRPATQPLEQELILNQLYSHQRKVLLGKGKPVVLKDYLTQNYESQQR